MHELSITENLLRKCLSEAKKHGLSRITKINVKTGILSGIVPECIQTYMDMLAEGTAAEGAIICSEAIPVKISCLDCGNVLYSMRAVGRCPSCGSANLKASGLNEFIIDSIEGDPV